MRGLITVQNTGDICVRGNSFMTLIVYKADTRSYYSLYYNRAYVKVPTWFQVLWETSHFTKEGKWTAVDGRRLPRWGRFYLWRLQGDFDTHGASDAWKLASQCLLGFMSHLWDVFDGQIKLEETIILKMTLIHQQSNPATCTVREL